MNQLLDSSIMENEANSLGDKVAQPATFNAQLARWDSNGASMGFWDALGPEL